MASKTLKQFNLLFINNWKFIKRNYFSYFISPIIFMVIGILIMSGLNILIHSYSIYNKETYFKPFSLGKNSIKSDSSDITQTNLNLCKKKDCSDLNVYFLGSKYLQPVWVENSIKRLNETFSIDIKDDYYSFKNFKEGFYADKEKNRFKNFIVFCYGDVGNFKLYESFNCKENEENNISTYFIGFNNTNFEINVIYDFTEPKKTDKNMIHIKELVDEEIIKVKDNNKDIKLNFSFMEFAKPKIGIFSEFNVYSTESLFFFTIIFILLSNKYIKNKAYEKSISIRKRLYIFGLNDTSYFLNEFINVLIKNIYQSLVFIIWGLIFQIQIFINANYFYHFLVFFVFSNALDFLGLFIITVVNRPKKALKINYLVILFSIFLIIFIKNDGLLKLLWSDLSPIITILRSIFSFFPSFLFATIYYHIQFITCDRVDFIWFEVKKGGKYITENLLESQKGEVFTKKFNIPADISMILIISGLSIFYLFLSIVFDNILIENKGKTYDFRSKNKIKDNENNLLDNDVNNINNDNKEYLIIKNVTKIYKGLFGLSQFKALNNVSLKIPLNSIYGLLGENGAGKSTLITLLSGLVPPNKGSIFIKRKNGKKEKLSSKNISICQQFNILYPDLSVYENLELFLKLKLLEENKSFNKKFINSHINDLIEALELTDKKTNLVKELSGGMQRRVSVLVSFLNFPEIVILDEPSAGLDPVNRKILLEFILKMKIKNNITIIISSHIIEEIQRMSDYIGIIHKGEKVIENTLNNIRSDKGKILKINLNCINDRESTKLMVLKNILNDEIIRTIQDIGNDISITYNSERYINFYIPNIKANLNLIKELESKNNKIINKYVYNISLGTNSLEECFFNLIDGFESQNKF